jgi:hypothetical protein
MTQFLYLGHTAGVSATDGCVQNRAEILKRLKLVPVRSIMRAQGAHPRQKMR